MNKKRIFLLIGAALIILLIIISIIISIILLNTHHIKLNISDNSNLSIVREGNEISLTPDEQSQLIDMIEDITIIPWRYPQSTGWTYRIQYTDTDNHTNSIVPLNDRIDINNKTYRTVGKSSKSVSEYLDSIYNKTLVTITIDNAESITVTNKYNHKTAVFTDDKLNELTEALAYKPSPPVTLYNDKDSTVRYVLEVQYKDGTSEELPIVQFSAILYKDQYLLIDSYALELIQEEVGN